MEPGLDDDLDTELPPRPRSPLTMVVAVMLVIALVGGGIVIALDRTDDTGGRERIAGDAGEDSVGMLPPVTAVGPPPTEQEVEAVVAEISDFVAGARELDFVRPVEVTLLPDAEFSARIKEEAVEDFEELDEAEDVLRALGLLERDVRLSEVLTTFLGAGVVGFYDPETGELVVRGASLTPYVRLTLAHELTHALDDQHFELHRPLLDEADDERGLAFGALVEGNALRIEDQYRATLSEAEQQEASREELALGAGLDLSRIPRVVPQIIGFPYIFGPSLVGALVEVGGEDRVNAAFADPPVTSEQVLDPEAWLAGESEPVVVPPAEAPAEVFDEGVLGVWGIVLLLEEVLGQRAAAAAATGWGGDWYVAWRDRDRTCVRATFVMDDGDELRELASGLDDWAAVHDDAEVTRGERDVTIASCA